MDTSPSPPVTEPIGDRSKVSVPDDVKFFNSILGNLKIELTEPPQRLPSLANEKALPTAKIKTLRFVPKMDDPQRDQYRELSAEELGRIAFPQPEIRLKGQARRVVSHKAPNGKYFTVHDLLSAVEETERLTRGESTWFGGIDIHHTFFEGIHPAADNVWEIHWGS